MTVRNNGNPAFEYAAARSGAAVITREDRAFIRMHGRDPMRIIQGIVTNDVAGAPADRAVYAALLTPKGRMLADVRIIRRTVQELLLDVPLSAVPSLLDVFRRTIPPLFAKFDDVTADYVMLGVYGPATAGLLTRMHIDVAASPDQDGLTRVEFEGDAFVMSTLETGPGGFDIVLPTENADKLHKGLVEAGATEIGAATFDVLRIEAGTPRWGAELNENTIPLEAGLLERAISTKKGCYTGQEVIIRVLHRGHVNWQLRGFLLGNSPTPTSGDTLAREGDEKAVARITSAAFSPLLDQTIALGYARRELELPAQLFLRNGNSAQVVKLPFKTSDAAATS